MLLLRIFQSYCTITVILGRDAVIDTSKQEKQLKEKVKSLVAQICKFEEQDSKLTNIPFELFEVLNIKFRSNFEEIDLQKGATKFPTTGFRYLQVSFEVAIAYNSKAKHVNIKLMGDVLNGYQWLL